MNQIYSTVNFQMLLNFKIVFLVILLRNTFHLYKENGMETVV